MSSDIKVWVFRILAALATVASLAIAGVVADAGHFGAFAPIVVVIQGVLISALGGLIRKWNPPSA